MFFDAEFCLFWGFYVVFDIFLICVIGYLVILIRWYCSFLFVFRNHYQNFIIDLLFLYRWKLWFRLLALILFLFNTYITLSTHIFFFYLQYVLIYQWFLFNFFCILLRDCSCQPFFLLFFLSQFIIYLFLLFIIFILHKWLLLVFSFLLSLCLLLFLCFQWFLDTLFYLLNFQLFRL